MTDTMNVEIVYCAPCGYLDRAVSLAGKILAAHDDDIDALTLVPADMGIFDVRVAGSLVFSKERAGRFPEPGEIVKHIPARPRELADGAACPVPD